MNWREADRTKLTDQTKRAIIVIEALPPTSTITLNQATGELTGLLENVSSGLIKQVVLSQNKSQLAIE